MAQIPEHEHKSFSPTDIKRMLERYIDFINSDVECSDLLEDLHHNVTCVYTQHNHLGCDACAYAKICEEGTF
jgi:hypothetical protein